MNKRKSNKKKRSSRGRPPIRVLKLDATPEEVARRIFDNAKPPDPKQAKTTQIGQAHNVLSRRGMVTIVCNSPSYRPFQLASLGLGDYLPTAGDIQKEKERKEAEKKGKRAQNKGEGRGRVNFLVSLVTVAWRSICIFYKFFSDTARVIFSN